MVQEKKFLFPTLPPMSSPACLFEQVSNATLQKGEFFARACKMEPRNESLRESGTPQDVEGQEAEYGANGWRAGGMGQGAGMDDRGKAKRLIEQMWVQRRMDASLAMCLVIPARDLIGNVEWGEELWNTVISILGVSSCQDLTNIVAHVRWIYMHKQATGSAPSVGDDSLPRFGCVSHGFQKVRCAESLRAMIQKNQSTSSSLCVPFVVQYVKAVPPGTPGRMSFRAYEYPQAMVLQTVQTIQQKDSGYICMYEAPLTRSGVCRLYIDYEIYLCKMLFIDQGSLEERVGSLERIADEFVEIWSMILVSLGVVNKTDIVKFVIKDNSRELGGGDYGVKRHIVSDLLVTRHTFEAIQQMTVKWIHVNCPAAYSKLGQKDAVTIEEARRMVDTKTKKSLLSLVGMDPACKSSLQPIRMVWTKKDTSNGTISTLREGVSVCNGKRVDAFKSVVPEAYTKEKSERAPHLEQGFLAAAMWDSLVTVPSPFCRGCNYIEGGRDVAARPHAWHSNGDEGGVSKRRRTVEGNEPGWASIDCEWFKRFSRASCGGKLPRINTSIRYATPPPGLEEGVLFQVNQTGINLCSRCMMDLPAQAVPHKHKSNGTVFCVLGDQVWFQCMDPECIKYIRDNGHRLHALARCLEEIRDGTQKTVTNLVKKSYLTKRDECAVMDLLAGRQGELSRNGCLPEALIGTNDRKINSSGKGGWWVRLTEDRISTILGTTST